MTLSVTKIRLDIVGGITCEISMGALAE